MILPFYVLSGLYGQVLLHTVLQAEYTLVALHGSQCTAYLLCLYIYDILFQNTNSPHLRNDFPSDSRHLLDPLQVYEAQAVLLAAKMVLSVIYV